MSLKKTTEQLQLEESLQDFFSQTVTAEYLKSRVEKRGRDEALWAKIQSLGLFEYLSAATEGSENKIRDLGTLARFAGRCLLPEPLAANLCCGAILFSSAQAADEIEEFAGAQSGVDKVEFAQQARGGAVRGVWAYGDSQIEGLELKRKGGETVLSGTIRFLPFADDVAFVLACPSDDGMFIIHTRESKRRAITALDISRPYGDIDLATAPAVKIKSITGAYYRGVIRTTIANELWGMCEHVLSLTVEYVKTRKQFDVPVGSFQAVQHKLADMASETAALGALADFAAWTGDASPEQLDFASTSALSFATERAPKIIETAIQLHGGIGFTWEYELHLYLRRARQIKALYGAKTADYQKLFAALSP